MTLASTQVRHRQRKDASTIANARTPPQGRNDATTRKPAPLQGHMHQRKVAEQLQRLPSNTAFLNCFNILQTKQTNTIE
jgi:hypothetical protein